MGKECIGLIGLGRMGYGIGRNLLRKGYAVYGYDVNPDATKRLAASGAVAADSPRKVAERSAFIITVLQNGPDVEQVVLGPDGILKGAKPGTILIDCSVIDPDITRRVGDTVRSAGCGMVDVGMGGMPTAAEEGALFLMIGGTPEDLERVEPLLKAMSKDRIHCGGPGMGVSVKLINNLLALSILSANLEAMAMGAKAGLSPDVVLKVFSSTFADNRLLHTLIPEKILKGDHEPGFTAELANKDAGLAVNFASRLKTPIWTMGQVRQLLTLVLAQGKGQKAHTVLATAIEEFTGIRFNEWK